MGSPSHPASHNPRSQARPVKRARGFKFNNARQDQRGKNRGRDVVKRASNNGRQANATTKHQKRATPKKRARANGDNDPPQRINHAATTVHSLPQP